MDINDIRALTTVILMVGFFGMSIFIWRSSAEKYQKYAETALAEDEHE